MGDTRFRIFWNAVWHYPQIETFHQFLDAVAVHTLGQDWFKAQSQLPLKNQSAIVKWRNAMMGLLRKPETKTTRYTPDIRSLVRHWHTNVLPTI
jgi:hypothetical protein